MPSLLQSFYNIKKIKKGKGGGGKNLYIINIPHNTLMAMAEVTSFADLVFLHEMLFIQIPSSRLRPWKRGHVMLMFQSQQNQFFPVLFKTS